MSSRKGSEFNCMQFGGLFAFSWLTATVFCALLGVSDSEGTDGVPLPTGEVSVRNLLTELSLNKSGCENVAIGEAEDVTHMFPQPRMRQPVEEWKQRPFRFFRVTLTNPNDAPIRELILQSSRALQMLLSPALRLFYLKKGRDSPRSFLYRVKLWNHPFSLLERETLDLYFAFQVSDVPLSIQIHTNECD